MGESKQPDPNTDRDRRRKQALEAIKRLARPFPPGWKFDREEAHERGGGVEK